LAFPKQDCHRPTHEFSGGCQMPIAPAKLLLEKPDLLLLDEPTNHLDLEARNWLEGYLKEYAGAFLLISHDRFFLDMTVQTVLEIWNKQVHFYRGNYSKYEVQKTQRRDLLKAAYKNQRDRIEQLEAFINRFRAQATKAKQVQSRIKELEKIERIEIPPEEKVMHFRFPQPPSSGRIVCELEGVAKRYGAKTVFEDVSLVIEKGDRIALVGHNGAGKSTLIRLLAGEEPSEGTITLGHKVEPDYFAQDQYKELDPTTVMFDEIGRLSPGMTDTEIRTLLGCFLFSGDDVFKPVGVLSGGERNRFALARLLLQPHNFLLLDEPTNHLDLRAKDVLLEAMMKFSGTLVFVSHDRYFIDRLATKVFAVGGGAIDIYPGNYEDYLWSLERRGEAANGDKAPGGPSDELLAAMASAKSEQPKEKKESKPAAVAATPAPPQNGDAQPRKRMNPIQANKLRARVAELEGEISKLEGHSEKLQTKMGAASGFEQQSELLGQLETCSKRIADCEREWEELNEKLEAEA
ncbi:MAG: ABC-F family ATP-binding cassette domain-containing protein, partial [Acidobacteria bacterium]|nr:ABC-F family ATP-binding cassette domain-containing protein [Acidobacteriota bacterium]